MANKNGFRNMNQPAMGVWGKPLGAPKKETKPSSEESMPYDDDDAMDEREIDVDAELATEDASDSELYEVTDEVDDYEDDMITAEDQSDDPEEEEYDDEEPDYDAELGDARAETKSTELTDEQEHVVVDAGDDVDYEEEAEDTVSKPRRKERVSMASSKTEKKKSMSDYVRDEISRRIDNDKSLRGKDIVAALAAKGVNVSPAQVSQLLKKAGVTGTKVTNDSAAATPRKPRQPRKEARTPVRAVAAASPAKKKVAHKAKPATATMQTPKRSTTESAGPFDVSAAMKLMAAANDFVAACGSHERATSVLKELPNVIDTFGD